MVVTPEGRSMLKRFLFAFLAFVGLIVPATFALASLADHPQPRRHRSCLVAIAISPRPPQASRQCRRA